MNEATIAQTILSLSLFLIFGGFLVWGIRSKQFHDVEESKYRMLEDDAAKGGADAESKPQGGDK